MAFLLLSALGQAQKINFWLHYSNKNARFTFVEIIYININKGPTL
jgi:hypothetical protein